MVLRLRVMNECYLNSERFVRLQAVHAERGSRQPVRTTPFTHHVTIFNSPRRN